MIGQCDVQRPFQASDFYYINNNQMIGQCDVQNHSRPFKAPIPRFLLYHNNQMIVQCEKPFSDFIQMIVQCDVQRPFKRRISAASQKIRRIIRYEFQWSFIT
ncbi:hypothetical protein CEXT_418271 [Caerostris extrusa]|uniref:Uncharacterized protein n=1 Tax=Caerostris extrusa TaxID=172846 RepID=A0AAV4NWL5_CAEEX|nr:hypothetical protein CEXT_418271 [Caerostris extrusa]